LGIKLYSFCCRRLNYLCISLTCVICIFGIISWSWFHGHNLVTNKTINHVVFDEISVAKISFTNTSNDILAFSLSFFLDNSPWRHACLYWGEFSTIRVFLATKKTTLWNLLVLRTPVIFSNLLMRYFLKLILVL